MNYAIFDQRSSTFILESQSLDLALAAFNHADLYKPSAQYILFQVCVRLDGVNMLVRKTTANAKLDFDCKFLDTAIQRYREQFEERLP